MNNNSFWNKIRQYPPGVILLEGTRALPLEDYTKLVSVGKKLAEMLPVQQFRSGNAVGSDNAFISGVTQIANASIELVVPYEYHRKENVPVGARVLSLDYLSAKEINELKSISAEANSDRAALTNLYQQGSQTLINIKSAFLLRDVLKVTGIPSQNFKPTTVGLFYVNKSKPLNGGTGHTIKVCKYLGVDYFTQDDFL